MRISNSVLLRIGLASGAALILSSCASTGGAPSTGNRTVDLLVETEDLQAELKQLRNQVELQQNAMDALKRRQRELYDDLDRRLRQRERLASTGVGQQQARLGSQGDDLRPVTEDTGDGDQAQQAYDAAFNLLKQSRYGDSIKSFSEFLEQHPRSQFAPNAQYWIAEANYVTREFEAALVEFQKLIKQYPDSQKYPDALLKIGYSQLELGRVDEGRQTLEDLVNQYPGTQVAISAKRRLEKDNP
ncbi:MAG TPA: tol-pal system protein YbgF [Acidiferrobacteraceae bacterium]|nr:tol-pal system protein YbgF [Acidiferrobacteraceae bacterium]